MALFTFANTKGGAGKTTAVALLATGLAARGHRVKVVDADPQRWFSRWFEGLKEAPAGLTAHSYISEASIRAVLEQAPQEADHVIVDLPGAASQTMALCIAVSDHVIIPVQGCAMDAEGGARVLEVIDYLHRKAGLQVSHSVMLSRVNPLISTRALEKVKAMLGQRGVRLLEAALVERAAFRDMFDHALPLTALDEAKVSNLAKARGNADQLVEACLAAAGVHEGAAAHMPRAVAA